MSDEPEYRMSYSNFDSFVFFDFLYTNTNDIIEITYLIYNNPTSKITHRNFTFIKNQNILTPETQQQTLIRTSDLENAPQFKTYILQTLEPLIQFQQNQFSDKNTIIVFQNQLKRRVFLEIYKSQIGPLPKQWHLLCFFTQFLEINPQSKYILNNTLRKYAESVKLNIKYTQPENTLSSLDDISIKKPYSYFKIDIMYATFHSLKSYSKSLDLVLFKYNSFTSLQEEEKKIDKIYQIKYLIISDIQDKKGILSFSCLVYQIESSKIVKEYSKTLNEELNLSNQNQQEKNLIKDINEIIKNIKENYSFICFNQNQFDQIFNNQLAIKNLPIPNSFKISISLSSIYTQIYQKQLSINQVLQDLNIKIEDSSNSPNLNVQKLLKIIVKLQNDGVDWNNYIKQ